MGNFRNIWPGDTCDVCKEGKLERIVIQPTFAESAFCLVTLGLGGGGGSQYFKCTKCKMENHSKRIYSEHLPDDEPLTFKQIRITLLFFLLIVICFFLMGFYFYGWGVLMGRLSK